MRTFSIASTLTHLNDQLLDAIDQLQYRNTSTPELEDVIDGIWNLHFLIARAHATEDEQL